MKFKSMKWLYVVYSIFILVSCGTSQYAGLPQLIESVKPSVVIVYSWDGDVFKGSGSGFFLNEEGDIVTNYHVINSSNASNGSIEVKVGGEYYKSREINSDPRLDLAIIRSDAPENLIHPVQMSLSHPKQGEGLSILGSPFGNDISCSNGIVTRLGRIDNYSFDVIQINAAIDQGYSGGPVIDQKGDVVGVAFRSRGPKEEMQVSSAIPIEYILNFTKNIFVKTDSNIPGNGVNTSQLIDARRWAEKAGNFRDILNYPEAIDCYNMSLELDPSNALVWNSKGWTLSLMGRPDDAIKCYDKALEIDESYSLFWNNKGLALDDIGRYEDALYYLNISLNIDSTSDTAWNNKGLALRHLGNLNEAIVCYDMAIKINPANVHAYANKAAALDAMNKPNEALESVSKATELDPQYYTGWNNKGGILHKLKRYEEAAMCFDNATEIDPSKEAAWSNKGEALYMLKKYDQALESINRAIEINAKSFGNWNLKRRILTAQGRADEASEALRQAKTLLEG